MELDAEEISEDARLLLLDLDLFSRFIMSTKRTGVASLVSEAL
jgi:hypothetical protein